MSLEWKVRLFERSFHLLEKDQIDDLLKINSEYSGLPFHTSRSNVQLDLQKVPIYTWGKKIKKKDSTIEMIHFSNKKSEKMKFSKQADLEIEKQLQEIGTNWKDMVKHDSLKHFTNNQVKQRAVNIKKQRVKNNIPLGSFEKLK